MYYTTDVRGFVRGAEIDVDPGVRFSTDDLSPIILGWVLERALRRHSSNSTLSNYLAERIWQPVGAEYDALWIVDREPGGLEKGESGLTARAIDLAKFAELYLRQGRWDSRQLIPAEWVSESTSVESDPRGPNVWDSGFFKHQWWGRKTVAPAQSDFYANGHFGQRLYVSPRHRLILVRMGDNNRGVDWADFLGAVADAFPLDAETRD
jgi:CubicO group peptidase (beta-lactamase class C family)